MEAQYESKWKTVYKRYRVIEKTSKAARLLLHKVVWSRTNVEDVLSLMRQTGQPLPPDPIIRNIADLQQFRMTQSKDRNDPYDDVYHVAFNHLHEPTHWFRPDVGGDALSLAQSIYLYRGQRRANWQVIPSIFRNAPSRTEIEERIRSANAFALQLRDHRGLSSYGDAIAVAQHYSKEAGVATWLIDVTMDPWTALFFASLGGEDGDLGRVEMISCKEWTSYANGPNNPLGSLQVYNPPGVKRIAAQRACFVEAPHPLLWEQYAPYQVRFRQHHNLVFCDADINITDELLFPEDDPLREIAGAFRSFAKQSVLPDANPDDLPAHLFVDPLSGETYRRMVLNWLPENLDHFDLNGIPSDILRALDPLCAFHARLQSPDVREIVGIPHRCIQRLSDTIDHMLLDAHEGGKPNWTEHAWKEYTNRIFGSPREHNALKAVMHQIDTEYPNNHGGGVL